MLNQNSPPRVVVAPDSYKESLPAAAVARAIAQGVRLACPTAEVHCVPMADGGEGSLAAVLAATGGQCRLAQVCNANGHAVQAAWGWLGEGRAFIEMAAAAGLEQIPAAERRPLSASTYGVGQLVLQALDCGAQHLVISLGGSATTDGGAGLLQALGARLTDAAGASLPPGGAALLALAEIDLSQLDARLRDIRFELAVDVENPLCGPQGAAAVFGPQKGAGPQDIQLLDRALAHFSRLCAQTSGREVSSLPGAGAAGGLGLVIKSFFQAEFRPGVELIAGLAGLEAAVREADLVFTGEGKLDRQTLLGKTPVGVARLARRYGADVIALAGALGEGYQAVYEAGITAAFSLVPGPMTLEQSCEHTPELLTARARDIMLLWMAGRAGFRGR